MKAMTFTLTEVITLFISLIAFIAFISGPTDPNKKD